MKKLIAIAVFSMIVFASKAQTYTDIKVSELPSAAREYVKQNMPGTGIARAVRIDNNGTLNYGAVCESRGRKYVLVFDQEGKFIQKADNLKSVAPKEKAPDKTSTGATNEKTPGQSSSHSQMKTIPVDKLPREVINYMNKEYPNGKILYARQLTRKDIPFYQVSVDGGDKVHVVTFNGKGQYVSKQYYYKAPARPSGTTPAPQQEPSKQPASETTAPKKK